MTRRNLNIQPTLTERPGLPVRIIVNRDLVFRPYQPLFFNRGLHDEHDAQAAAGAAIAFVGSPSSYCATEARSACVTNSPNTPAYSYLSAIT